MVLAGSQNRMDRDSFVYLVGGDGSHIFPNRTMYDNYSSESSLTAGMMNNNYFHY